MGMGMDGDGDGGCGFQPSTAKFLRNRGLELFPQIKTVLLEPGDMVRPCTAPLQHTAATVLRCCPDPTVFAQLCCC